jgi:hypothetical protein
VVELRREHGFEILGRDLRDAREAEARYHFITPGYTQATGRPLLAGRDLAASDGEDAPPVILVNEAAARKFWTTPRPRWAGA